jgi:hypothetical protein
MEKRKALKVHLLTGKEKAPTIADWGFLTWWPGTESNHRHADFQSAALPTELPGQDRQYNSRWAGYRGCPKNV